MYVCMYININENTKRDPLVNEQLNLHEQRLEDQLHPGKPTWQWKANPFEDVAPIENGDVRLPC